MKQTYAIRDLAPHINWVYFFHAWGFRPRPDEPEAAALRADAEAMLARLDSRFHTYALFEWLPTVTDGDDLLLGNPALRLPLLRQQVRRRADDMFLCLSDFVRPAAPDGSPTDSVGVFAACVEPTAEGLYADDPYRRLLVQTLCDRLAEATAERLHTAVAEGKGIRPAVGYPSLPDQSVNFILDKLIDFSQIGIRLTDNGMMTPHASVSGLILTHPAARYFAVGHIGEDQLEDYARRRGLSPAECRKFLAKNL
jgi:cobalamin-dependent methionine synthase I